MNRIWLAPIIVLSITLGGSPAGAVSKKNGSPKTGKQSSPLRANGEHKTTVRVKPSVDRHGHMRRGHLAHE